LPLAGAMIVATGTCAFAQVGYWVVGNRATAKCEIVTSNPVINAQVGGNILFGAGPYKSLDDTKLARSTIPNCLAVEEPPANTQDDEKNPIRAVFSSRSRQENASTQKALVHGVAATGHTVEAYGRVELCQFRFKLLVDPQQRLEGTADVAIATRYDLIDGGFACVGNHGYFSDCTLEQFAVSAPVPVDVGYSAGARLPPNQARAQMAKVSAALYKTDNDVSMTPLSTERVPCGQPTKPAPIRAVARGCRKSAGNPR
jgi:hypothetical protein